MAQGRNRWLIFANTATDIKVPQRWKMYWPDERLLASQGKFCPIVIVTSAECYKTPAVKSFSPWEALN
jgi:hypothetical protein